MPSFGQLPVASANIPNLAAGSKLAAEWRPARLDRMSGVVTTVGAAGDGYLYYVPDMHKPPRVGKAERRLPLVPFQSRCPRCDANWSGRTVGSPIRGQRTGFQRVAQVLADALLRIIAPAENDTNRKLVVFSDSRQDAAKLSAGMRQAHHLDAVRQALVESLATAGMGRGCLLQTGPRPVAST